MSCENCVGIAAIICKGRSCLYGSGDVDDEETVEIKDIVKGRSRDLNPEPVHPGLLKPPAGKSTSRLRVKNWATFIDIGHPKP